MVIRDPKPQVEYDPMATTKGPVRVASVEADAEIIEDQLKRGESGRREILCDEPANLGGLDLAPAPLHYFALGILF